MLFYNINTTLCSLKQKIWNNYLGLLHDVLFCVFSEVVPVHKIHPPASIQNDLRPISLLPTVAKVLEGIVRDWLMPSLEPSLDVNQFGCRPGRSTTHALIAIQHKWLQTLDDKGSVRALFVDFKKAFDIVNHNILFAKLKNFNTSHCLLKWFASYLFHRCQRVTV